MPDATIELDACGVPPIRVGERLTVKGAGVFYPYDRFIYEVIRVHRGKVELRIAGPNA